MTCIIETKNTDSRETDLSRFEHSYLATLKQQEFERIIRKSIAHFTDSKV